MTFVLGGRDLFISLLQFIQSIFEMGKCFLIVFDCVAIFTQFDVEFNFFII